MRTENQATRYPPPRDFADRAVGTAELYDAAARDRLQFWSDQARQHLTWHTPFRSTLDWSNAPIARWFADGELNVAVNCVDRHVVAGHGDRVAIHWEGEPGDRRTISYAQLAADVAQAANLLTSLGIAEGDRVAIYLPMIPEAVIAMLAVARLGAIHSVVFGGFSAESLRSRLDDAEAKLVITADGGWRKGRVFPLKPTVDEALAATTTRATQHSVEHVLVVNRCDNSIEWTPGRDLWWHDEVNLMDTVHTAHAFPAETPLFILYTSGTTGRPKGILHTSGGYLTQVAYTHRAIFDLRPDEDVYWCTADVGWITGHSYVVYGPLANGATQVIYEGTPEHPRPGRWWDIVERYGVTTLYTAPTAIRSFMKQGPDIPAGRDLSSLRLLGSVGEPINPAAWQWFRDVIGGAITPVVDTWWQTETGAIMLSALPGVTTLKPGSAQVPVPGVSVAVVADDGTRVARGDAGLLVVSEPWPSMARGIWGDHDRFIDTYWSRIDGVYLAGDGARIDADGDIWLLGRVDDVMNVSGHRLSTAEIESALVAHAWTAEAAVIGASDDATGQAIIAFVIMTEEAKRHGLDAVSVANALRTHVAEHIGHVARPRDVPIVDELPKTRSGKIMRRLLRDAVEGRSVGDTTSLADTAVMQTIGDHLRC